MFKDVPSCNIKRFLYQKTSYRCANSCLSYLQSDFVSQLDGLYSVSKMSKIRFEAIFPQRTNQTVALTLT